MTFDVMSNSPSVLQWNTRQFGKENLAVNQKSLRAFYGAISKKSQPCIYRSIVFASGQSCVFLLCKNRSSLLCLEVSIVCTGCCLRQTISGK